MSTDEIQFLDQMVDEVHKIADEHPDFVYTDDNGVCEYHPTQDNPHGCIIGYAARRLGRSLDDAAYSGLNAWDALEHLLETHWDLEDPHVVGPLGWLGYVQNAQDNGEAWLQCVLDADDAVMAPTEEPF